MTSRAQRLTGAGAIAIVGGLGILLAAQGWRSRLPGTDAIPYIDSARALLSHGRIPDHGVVTSLSSYAPPGFAWAMVPGVRLLAEPRLFEVPGSAILHLATLAGLFVLARACCGFRCALLSVLLYGLSERGLMFAGSLGFRGHPFFYVWMAYWTCRWVARQDPRCLAAAVLTWLVAVNVFIEAAPAVLALPMVWAIYRPPVRARSLSAAVVLGLIVWSPYLRFEAGRGFADLRSQVLVINMPASDARGGWCDPTVTFRREDGLSIPPSTTEGFRVRDPDGVLWLGGRVLSAVRGLVGNFEGLMPGGEVLLLAFTLGGMLTIVARRQRIGPDPRRLGAPSWWRRARGPAIALLLAGSVLGNERVISLALGVRHQLGPTAVIAIRELQAAAAAAAVALLLERRISRWLRRLAAHVAPTPWDPGVMLVCLVAPWVALLAVVEVGRQDRLIGLWPVQVIVLAFFIVTVIEQVRARRFAAWTLAAAVAGALLFNPFSVARVQEWLRDGHAGVDPGEVRLADALAARLRSSGRDRAWIGYRLPGETIPAPPWRSVDTRWKVGNEIDAFLEYRHGMANLDQCGEGVAPNDELRVVAVGPFGPDAVYSEAPGQGDGRLVQQIGGHRIYEVRPLQ